VNVPLGAFVDALVSVSSTNTRVEADAGIGDVEATAVSSLPLLYLFQGRPAAKKKGN